MTGPDVVDGQSGDDELTFNGSDAADAHRRVRAAAGACASSATWALWSWTSRASSDVRIDALGGADQFVLAGTEGEDRVTVGGEHRASRPSTGCSAVVRIRNADATDALTVSTLGGADTVDATALKAGALRLTADAGPGGDDVFGSPGDDVLLGGDGADLVDPNRARTSRSSARRRTRSAGTPATARTRPRARRGGTRSC